MKKGIQTTAARWTAMASWRGKISVSFSRVSLSSYLFTPSEAKVHVNLDNSFITLPFTRIVDDAQLKISLVHETN